MDITNNFYEGEELTGIECAQAVIQGVEFKDGIKKLQISCVVEDDKVGSDILDEKISAFEDHVQSVDIAAFNKI